MPNPAKVKVADYYDVVHRASWTRRTAASLAGGTLGVMYGGVIGIIAAFLPALFKALGIPGAEGSLPELEAVAKSAALFAGVGGFTGIAGMQLVTSESGAVAAGFEEKETREKLTGMVPQAAIRSAKAEKMAEEHWSPSIFNWRVAAVTVPLFAAFGAMAAYSGLLPNTTILNFASGSAAAAAAGASVAGMFGACIGFKNSVSTNQLENFYTRAVQGKFFGGDRLEAAQAQDTAIAQTAPSEPEQEPVRDKAFAANTRRFSLQAVLEGTEHPDPGLRRLH